MTEETQHPLQTSWTLYYLKPEKESEDYANSIHAIGKVQTIEEFWTYFSHIKRPCDLEKGTELHVFRNDFRGMWEDPVNRDGGRWFVCLEPGYSSQIWEKSVLALIGEQLDPDIIGVVIAIKDGTDILSFWNKTSSNETLLINIAKSIGKVFELAPQTQIKYRRHQEPKDGFKPRSLSYKFGSETKK